VGDRNLTRSSGRVANLSGVRDRRPTPGRTHLPVLDERERAALEDADSRLLHLQEAFETAARLDALDMEAFRRLNETARETIHRLNNSLPPHLDADARDEIRRRFIEMLTLPTEDDVQPLDIADKALMETEAVRHIFRDVLQDQAPADLRQAGAVIGLLDEWLPGLTVRQRAELLGISDRQLQRRRQDAGGSTARMQTVARLVAILRHGWTDQGVFAWFHRPRPALDEQAPIDVLDDPTYERTLILAARSGRVQSGS